MAARGRRPGIRRAGVLGLLAPLLLTACTVIPSERPAVLEQDRPASDPPGSGREPAELPPLGEPGNDSVGWTPCEGKTRQRLERELGDAAKSLKLDCATITGSLDSPDQPDHGFVSIPLVKAGKDDGAKIPLVAVDDIDGELGTTFAAKLAARLPDDVLDTFAVIGFDRRGTGESNPIDCIPESAREEMLGVDPAGEDLEPLQKAVRTAGQRCSIALGNEQGAYNAERTAADLQAIRGKLGVPRLHAIARGDGSRVLTAYGRRYTEQLGRVVLDGVPDPSKQAEAALAEVAAGAENTLDAFADDCAADDDCPLGADARKAVTRLLDRLRAESHNTEDNGVHVGPAHALYAVWMGLRSPERWQELATAVDQALDGKVDRLAEFTAPMLGYTGTSPPTLDAALATMCNDTKTRLSGERIAELAGQWREKHPVFGGLVAQRLVWCGQWPVRTEPLPDPDIPGAPPTVLISTAADPVTPERGTTRAADQLTGARQISWQGAGHGAVGRSKCATDNVARFLVDGRLPRNGVNCPA